MRSKPNQQTVDRDIARLRRAGTVAITGMAVIVLAAPWMVLAAKLDEFGRQLEEMTSQWDAISASLERIEQRLEAMAAEVRSMSDRPPEPATEPPCTEQGLQEVGDGRNEP